MPDIPGTALITGASSGIGAVFARQLAARGHALILAARRADRLEALATELRQQHNITAEVLTADLACLSDLERVEHRLTNTNDLTLLINNAGFGTRGSFDQVEFARHLGMIDVHVIATVRLTHAALPGMKARGRGAIINVSSLAGFVPRKGSATYGATKAYLNSFSQALGEELRGAGVKVQALCPGFTYTEFHDTRAMEGFSRSEIPKMFWMSAEEVVAHSLAALERNQVICIPGLRNRVLKVATQNRGILSALLAWRRRRSQKRI